MSNTSNSTILPLKREIDKPSEFSIESAMDFEKLKEDIDSLKALYDLHSGQLSRLEQSIHRDNGSVREELVLGIRLLGERVSKALQEMDQRFQNLKNELETQEQPTVAIEPAPEPDDSEFGTIKENSLIGDDKFEIVSKEHIERLKFLFDKHSQSVRTYISNQQKKIEEFEQILKKYEESITVIDSMKNRMTRYFIISLAGIGVVTVLCVLFKFVL